MPDDRPTPPHLPSGNETGDIEAEARRLISEARALLESLRVGRETVEARLQEHGRVDAMRHVRGTSSLDLAIETTRTMLVSLERIGEGGSRPDTGTEGDPGR